MTDLHSQIGQHVTALAALSGAVEKLTAEIDGVTGEAREKLREYQTAKRSASAFLSEASKRYSDARRLFARVSDIEAQLLALKGEHRALSLRVIRGDDDKARESMLAARESYHSLVKRLEQLQREAAAPDPDEE